MNIIRRKTYKLEMDVWEALQGKSEKEIDAVIKYMKNELSHVGNVKLTLVSDERL